MVGIAELLVLHAFLHCDRAGRDLPIYSCSSRRDSVPRRISANLLLGWPSSLSRLTVEVEPASSHERNRVISFRFTNRRSVIPVLHAEAWIKRKPR